MAVIPRVLFVLMLVVIPIVVWTTSAALPARVATHFARNGYANGWMSRDGYQAFMLAMTTLLPLFVVATVGFVPRFASRLVPLRALNKNREHWFASERREATLDWLASHACWMGILLSGFIAALHVLTLRANLVTPARLPEPVFVGVLVAFLVCLGIWIATLALRFRVTKT